MGEWNGPENKRHVLTPEEAQRGRENITEKRRVSCALNPAKHGRYSKSGLLPDEFLNCNDCKHRKSCSFYRKDASCRIVGIEPMKSLVAMHGISGLELLQLINRELVSYGLRARGSENLAEQRHWVRLLMEFFKLKFGSRELIMQVSKTLSDEEFESLIEIYKRKVLKSEGKGKRVTEAVV